MAISGFGLAAIGAGIAFAWGGVTNRSPLSAILLGIRGGNPASIPSASIAAPSAPSQPSAATGTAVSSSNSANKAIGQMLASQYGWGSGQEWQDLVSLWNKESGWNNTADTRVTHAGGDNASSTTFAYGIAQARPATKYPQAGQPPDLGGSADPTSQIQWGLNYIQSRYGSPSAAWQHELANNWY